MSNCSSGCKTQGHASYGECMRSKRTSDRNTTKTTDDLYYKELVNTTEINEYKAARAQGIQPRGSKLADIRYAVAASQKADQALTIS